MAKTTKDNKEMSVEEAKKQALKLTLEKLDKTYGKGTVRALGDNPVEDVEVYSTGSIGLDAALGVGGYLLVKQLLHCTLSPKYKKLKGRLLLSMLNTLSTLFTHNA